MKKFLLLFLIFISLAILSPQKTFAGQTCGCGYPNCGGGPMCVGGCEDNYCSDDPWCAACGDSCDGGCSGRTRWYECESCGGDDDPPPPTNTPIPTPTFTPTPTPTPTLTPTLAPWLVTQNGDAFSQYAVQFGNSFMHNTLARIVNINNAELNSLLGLNGAAYFSTYYYLQDDDLNCSTCSKFKFYKNTNYNDANDTSTNGWYEDIRFKLAQSNLIDKLDTGSFTIGVGNSGMPAEITGKSGISVWQMGSGSGTVLTVNSGFHCTTKTIFLVNGNLRLNPDITAANTAGCMFVVKGSTQIYNGLPTPRGPINTVNYDRIYAFIVTDSIETFNDSSVNDSDGLVIKGSIITRNNTFRRDVSRIDYFTPSEVISYDPRYINIFGKVLDNEIEFNIQEKQFIDVIN